ncbi:MAG: hypothetical protein ACI4WM_03155, partial [Erysipelotrichaceae bacterium]
MKKTDGLICLTLMNKNTKILDFDYDQEIHAVIHIDAIYNKDYAPLAIQNEKQGITRAQLNSWWKGRSIPASRDNYEAAMIELGISSSEELVEKCNGLSLSDQYWVKECDSSLNWGDINFFHNNFSEDVGKILVGQGTDSKEISLVSPDNTSDGNLIKKWKIIDGKRCLIKGGTHKNQEPYNEVIATKLYERLFDINEFVKYELYEEDNRAFSKCETMISTDEELVSAYSIISFYKCPSHISIYEHYLSSCEKL